MLHLSEYKAVMEACFGKVSYFDLPYCHSAPSYKRERDSHTSLLAGHYIGDGDSGGGVGGEGGGVCRGGGGGSAGLIT